MKLKQAETNCLKTILSQGYILSERRDRLLGGLKEKRFLTLGSESVCFEELRVETMNPSKLKLFYRWDTQNDHHDKFFQHYEGDKKCV